MINNLMAKSFEFSSFPDVGDADTGVWCVWYLTPDDARLVDKWRLTAVMHLRSIPDDIFSDKHSHVRAKRLEEEECKKTQNGF